MSKEDLVRNGKLCHLGWRTRRWHRSEQIAQQDPQNLQHHTGQLGLIFQRYLEDTGGVLKVILSFL